VESEHGKSNPGKYQEIQEGYGAVPNSDETLAGSFLKAQGELCMKEDLSDLARFVVHVLKTVLPIRESCVCLRAVTGVIGDRVQGSSDLMKTWQDISEKENFLAISWPGGSEIECYPLQSDRRTYGCILLAGDDDRREFHYLAGFLNAVTHEIERRHFIFRDKATSFL
jgi:hypothetical protein